ncbi:MAG: yocH 2 [Firmicutes bacterium]|nr:yocH 2 [Bacillota bacterium]
MMLLIGFGTLNVSAAGADGSVNYGDRGDEVKIVQRLLAETGFYAGEIDGVFGQGTAQAVKSFQMYNGLSGDGVAGRDTVAYLRRSTTKPDRYSRAVTVSASAYTRYDSGNCAYTARGHVVRRGLVAVDPDIIPLGTRLYINGYGYAIADDVGGAIQGNSVDLAFDNVDEAMGFGRRKVTVYILD